MIVYDLLCVCGTCFEGWFKDRDDFLSQEQQGMLICPDCGGNGVSKILSPVRYQSPNQGNLEVRSAESEGEKVAMQLLRGMRKYVKDNFEDVGAEFAREALKIHFGTEKSRQIYGVATADEENMLAKEGVSVVKIPFPVGDPEDPVN